MVVMLIKGVGEPAVWKDYFVVMYCMSVNDLDSSNSKRNDCDG